MMLQARQHNEFPSRCIFYEPFNSEQETRLKGGTPTDVTYSNGVGTFNGTSSYIKYNTPISKGQILSIRLKFTTGISLNGRKIWGGTSTAARIFSDASNRLSFSSFGANTKYYVNGGSTAYSTAGYTLLANTEYEIVLYDPTGLPASKNYFYLGSYEPLSQYFDGSIDFIEIYNYALTASEVANLYSG